MFARGVLRRTQRAARAETLEAQGRALCPAAWAVATGLGAKTRALQLQAESQLLAD